MATNDLLSADELALYDRQLRVWGAEGQNRIKNASILLINVNGVGNEVVKNLTLSGVGSLELWDDSIVGESDLTAQFFLSEDDLGKSKLESIQPRIKDMNPRVNLSINTSPLNLDIEDISYFQNFNLVIANNLSAPNLIKLNDITRELGISLHYTETHGLYGYLFNDLLFDLSTYTEPKLPLGRKIGPISKNQEIVDVTTKHDKETNRVLESFTIRSSYVRYKDALNSKQLSSLSRRTKKRISPLLATFFAIHELELESTELTLESLKSRALGVTKRLGINEVTDESYFEAILKQLNHELSPVAAVLGGTLSQDVINFLSKKKSPINNLLVLDGDKFLMPIYEL